MLQLFAVPPPSVGLPFFPRLTLVDDRFRNWPVLDGGTVTSSNPSVLARHAGDGARSLDRRHGHRQ